MRCTQATHPAPISEASTDAADSPQRRVSRVQLAVAVRPCTVRRKGSHGNVRRMFAKCSHLFLTAHNRGARLALREVALGGRAHSGGRSSGSSRAGCELPSRHLREGSAGGKESQRCLSGHPSAAAVRTRAGVRLHAPTLVCPRPTARCEPHGVGIPREVSAGHREGGAPGGISPGAQVIVRPVDRRPGERRPASRNEGSSRGGEFWHAHARPIRRLRFAGSGPRIASAEVSTA